MKKTELEAQFITQKKSLEHSKAEILEFLKLEDLPHEDKLRLSRVLQIIDRFQPKVKVDPQIKFWEKYLSSAVRLLPSRLTEKKGAKPKYQDVSAQSYIVADQALRVFKKLKTLEIKFKKHFNVPEDEILNQPSLSQLEREERIDTSLTLDYEKKAWGVDRILVDGIQNHLPSDSNGSRVWIQVMDKKGKWLSLTEAKANKIDIKQVKFVDDGVGFDVKNLALFYSTKSEEAESRGNFGEGMKMMCAAALREGLSPILESQNWQAEPAVMEVPLHDTRQGKTKNVQQMVFNTKFFKDKPLRGSRTTFRQVTPKFIEELYKIEDKVLPLVENYHPYFKTSHGDIVGFTGGKLYVKDLFICDHDTIFSYNFNDAQVNRDRNMIVDKNNWTVDRIWKILGELNSKSIIKILLKSILNNPDALEGRLNIHPAHPQLWQEAFYEAFGKETVLDTEYKLPEMLKKQDIKRIKFPPAILRALIEAKVETDRERVPAFIKEVVPTMLSIETGHEAWNEERMLLDAVQNHLPSDSGGRNLGLRFQTQNGEWHNFQGLKETKDDDIKAIKIWDDGRGYDYQLLGLIHSQKKDEESAGRFGEGLKMLSVAALRQGVDVSLHSRDWFATPKIATKKIDGENINYMVYEVAHALKNKKLDDDEGNYHESSSTVFANPTKALLSEFRQIDKKVLSLQDKKPLDMTPAGNILEKDGGLLFAHQILIPGDHRLLFSYHLPKLKIPTRERSKLAREDIEPNIQQILAEMENPDLIREYLLKAQIAAQTGEAEMLEFSTYFTPKNLELWKKIFTETFGQDISIRNVSSQDFDQFQQNMHVGLKMLSFPAAVYRVLTQLNLPTYVERIKEATDVEHIAETDLTAEEKNVLQMISKIDQFLPGNRDSDIKVYVRKQKDQKVASGYSDGKNIHLLRTVLADLRVAADVYIHEKTHHNTSGAQDAGSDFRNYLTQALASLALSQVK